LKDLRWLFFQNGVGLVSEKLYPTVNQDEACFIPQSKPDGVHVSDFSCHTLVNVSSQMLSCSNFLVFSYVGTEESLIQYISSVGPVTVSVDASMWSNYQGGVIQHHCGEISSNHAVTIVGYDLTGKLLQIFEACGNTLLF
jgi:hypothetical protein